MAENIQSKIKQTKDNGILVECALVVDPVTGNLQPEIFKYNGYYHNDMRTWDYVNKKCLIWVNKIRSKNSEITKIRNDNKLTVKKETDKGAVL